MVYLWMLDAGQRVLHQQVGLQAACSLKQPILSYHNTKQIDNPLFAPEVYYKVHAVLSSKYETIQTKSMEISHVQWI